MSDDPLVEAIAAVLIGMDPNNTRWSQLQAEAIAALFKPVMWSDDNEWHGTPPQEAGCTLYRLGGQPDGCVARAVGLE